MRSPGTLVFFAGKMGAGKSTRSHEVARERKAVLLSEDDWLATLYPDEIHAFEDYLRLSRRLKPLLRAHVTNMLQVGANVVLDFPANTVRQRAWFKRLADDAGARHELIYLDVSDSQCLRQIRQRRREKPERAAFDTESVFFETRKYFEAPSESESLNIHRVE